MRVIGVEGIHPLVSAIGGKTLIGDSTDTAGTTRLSGPGPLTPTIGLSGAIGNTGNTPPTTYYATMLLVGGILPPTYYPLVSSMTHLSCYSRGEWYHLLVS